MISKHVFLSAAVTALLILSISSFVFLQPILGIQPDVAGLAKKTTGLAEMKGIVKVADLPLPKDKLDENAIASLISNPEMPRLLDKESYDKSKRPAQNSANPASTTEYPLVQAAPAPVDRKATHSSAPAASSQVTSPTSALTVATAFEGLTEQSLGARIPPDVQVAAGPNHVVEMVNSAASIWTKQGEPVKAFTLVDFFETVSPDIGDVRIMYDYQSSRWFAALFEIGESESYKTVHLAVSQGNDPTAGWFKYSIPFGTVCPDQPKIGISDDKFVLSVDAVNQCRGEPGTFIYYGAQYLVFNKSDLTAGTNPQYDFYTPGGGYVPAFPVQADSPTSTLYMATIEPIYSATPSPTTLSVLSIDGNVPNTSVTSHVFSLGNIVAPPPAVQLGTAEKIDTHDSRIQTAHWYKGKLWLGFNFGCIFAGDTENRSCFKLIEINTSSFQILQNMSYGTGGYYYFYPALRLDRAGNLDVIFGYSSPNHYPSLAYVGRQASDPPNTLQAPFILVAGSAPTSSACGNGFDGCRYGDYFGAGTDPSDPGKVWLAGEFQSSQIGSIWKTEIAGMVRSTVTIGTDKSSYTMGETVTVVGNVTGIIPNQQVTIQVLNPNGQSYRLQQANVASDGSFSDSFALSGSLGITGSYTVSASYNGISALTYFGATSSGFPVAHMSDTTQTYGSLTYSGRSLNTVLATSSSQLVGDQIDRITLRIWRTPTAPTGTVEIGIFDANAATKKLFGMMDASTISTSPQDHSFSLTNGELYTIQSGDRIGIKYAGGSSTTGVYVMTDKDPADPFDGQNTYRARYQSGSWLLDLGEDLYMILEQTHAPGDFVPIIHMQDTTATIGSVTYAGRQINAEYVDAISQLIGNKIDSITLRLQKVGSPTGSAQVGVFNADLSVKKLFGTIDVSTISTSFQDYEFKLGGSELYTIQAGDRIGIKYNAGTTSNAISVMNDRDPADPFDGNRTYRARYESSWIVSYSEDLYMTLKQTHDGSTAYPITHMSDTTINFAALVSAPRQLMAEYVTPSSQLVGDKIDSITLRLQKIGSPTGTAQIGVFNPDLSVKRLFATVDVATLSTSATDIEFKLPVSDALYTVAGGDRIGIKYTGGTGSAGINVTPDRDAADPFDGANSYRVRYESGWITSTAEDMYMLLKQTRAS